MSKKKDSFLKQSYITQTHGFLDVLPKRDLWKQIGKELNGEFKISHDSGGVLEILKLIIPYKNNVIKLSESDTRPMKFEIEFESQLDFDLTIGHEDMIERILKKLGKKELEIGNERFDNHYLIKSKDKENTLRLFTTGIINYLLEYDVYSLSYITDNKENKSNLTTVISRTVDDKKTITDLIEMHKLIVDRLLDLHIIK